MPSAIFSKYIGYFVGDWANVAAYAQKPPGYDGRKSLQIEGIPFLVDYPANAKIFMTNVDSSFWAIISESEAEIAEIPNRWPHTRATAVTLAK